MTRQDTALLAIATAMLALLLAVSCRFAPSLTAIAYLLYCLELVTNGVGAYLAIADLRKRLPLLRTFHVVTAGELPLTYNELRSIPEILGDREPTIVAARLRNGLNEVIEALRMERIAREATDGKLAALSDVGARLGRLKFAACLLVVGVLLGGVGNIVGQMG